MAPSGRPGPCQAGNRNWRTPALCWRRNFRRQPVFFCPAAGSAPALDSIALSGTLTEMGLRDPKQMPPAGLDTLHAIRIAVIEHMFLLAARLPGLAPHAGTRKEDVLAMVFRLHGEEAADLLEEVFPAAQPSLKDYALAEPATYPDESALRYTEIKRDFVEPLRTCTALIKEVTRSISHYYSAVG